MYSRRRWHGRVAGSGGDAGRLVRQANERRQHRTSNGHDVHRVSPEGSGASGVTGHWAEHHFKACPEVADQSISVTLCTDLEQDMKR